jgi:hypothetical protein
MKIHIEEQYEKTIIGKKIIGYRADFIELSGSPLVGTGKTKEEAIATLFLRNIQNLGKLDLNILEINGVLYEDYIKNNR